MKTRTEKRISIVVLIAIVCGMACPSALFAADPPPPVLSKNCDSVEAWSIVQSNGGVVQADQDIRHEGRGSIRFSWEPEPTVWHDGTMSTQEKPEGAYAAIRSQDFEVKENEVYAFRLLMRIIGSMGWKSGDDQALFKLEIVWKCADKTITQSAVIDQKYPEWTEITSLREHQSSDLNPGKEMRLLVPPPGARKAQIRCHLILNKRIATVWLDDLWIGKYFPGTTGEIVRPPEDVKRKSDSCGI